MKALHAVLLVAIGATAGCSLTEQATSIADATVETVARAHCTKPLVERRALRQLIDSRTVDDGIKVRVFCKDDPDYACADGCPVEAPQ